MTIHWKAVEQYVTVVLGLLFQFYPVCNFGQFINLGLGTVKRERLNALMKVNGGQRVRY